MLLQTTFRAVFYTLILTASIKNGLRFINHARELNQHLQSETICKLTPPVLASFENGTAYLPVKYLNSNKTYVEGTLKYPSVGTKSRVDLQQWLNELPAIFSCRLYDDYLYLDISEIQAIIVITVVIFYCILCCVLSGIVIICWYEWLLRVFRLKRD